MLTFNISEIFEPSKEVEKIGSKMECGAIFGQTFPAFRYNRKLKLCEGGNLKRYPTIFQKMKENCRENCVYILTEQEFPEIRK